MSAEVTIVCDKCSVIIVAARTAGEARKEGIRHKMMVRRDGEDICRECAAQASVNRKRKESEIQ